MKDLYELISLRDSLPKGNIYKKVISGKTYFYHQYSEFNIKHTKKVCDSIALEMQKQIEQRKEIEKEIKRILDSGRNDVVLSKNARELTGYVMLQDKEVAEFDHGDLINIKEKLCPLMIKRTKSIYAFLKYRTIDSGRTNSRLLKKALNIKDTNEDIISLYSYAASISDDYWFKPKHSKLTFKDITFNNDVFFNISLKGLMTFYPNKALKTPELTTNGSFEKGWRNIDGEWWLYKSGTKNELFSEVFYATLFEKISLPTAHYEIEGNYIKTKNFAERFNFEPMVALVGEDESYDLIYSKLKTINEDIALDYIRLTFFDVILNNVDRHNENIGILRDKTTGQIVSLSPNFDNNISLISREDKLNTSTTEGFLKYYVSELKKHPELIIGLKRVQIPLLTKDILNECFEKINIEVDQENITDFILNRYNFLINIINK